MQLKHRHVLHIRLTSEETVGWIFWKSCQWQIHVPDGYSDSF